MESLYKKIRPAPLLMLDLLRVWKSASEAGGENGDTIEEQKRLVLKGEGDMIAVVHTNVFPSSLSVHAVGVNALFSGCRGDLRHFLPVPSAARVLTSAE